MLQQLKIMQNECLSAMVAKHLSYQQRLVLGQIHIYHINKDDEVYKRVDFKKQMNKESSWLIYFIHNNTQDANELNQAEYSRAQGRLV